MMKKKVIAVFLIFFAVHLFVSLLAYKGSSSASLHNEILKYFTQADIAKGEDHARAGFAADISQTVIFSFLLLVLSFTSVTAKLEALCDRLTGKRFILTSICFFAVLYIVYTLIFLPFQFYFSYVLEHRFGFSNMSVGFWFWTLLKSFSLNLLFICLIGSAALMIIKKLRFYAVLAVPVGGLVLGFALTVLYPAVILPLFYEIRSVENQHLEKRIIETAEKSGVSVDKINIIKESDYSNHTNAFFIGFGRNKQIYLYDTLLRTNSESEVVVILTHEIGHWVYNHTVKGILFGFLLSLGAFILIYLCVQRIRADSGFRIGEMHSPSIVPLYLLLFMIFSNITTPAQMIVSRMMEREADRYSLVMTDDPDAFISSEIRLARDNSARLNRNPVSAFLRMSHPETIERIKMAETYKAAKGRIIK